MKINNAAFAEGESSLFIVQTPFQAMCAINAIRQLKIEKYELELHLYKDNGHRNKQTEELVQLCGVDYKVAKTKPLGIWDLLKMPYCFTNRFNRVFLGTHLYHDGYYYALREIRRGGNLVLLDDGIASLTLLDNEYHLTGRSILSMAYYRMVSSLRHIKLNNILTVYKGKENPKWNIAFNDITVLRQYDTSEKKGLIFFIGTNNSQWVTRGGVNKELFKKIFFDILNQIKEKHPDEKIIYIPHGRDKSDYTKQFCEDIGIEYRKLDINIEMYIIKNCYIPKAIYGFSSSALYNLKIMFPESDVTNLLIKPITDKSHTILDIASYYEKQGIRAVKYGYDVIDSL